MFKKVQYEEGIKGRIPESDRRALDKEVFNTYACLNTVVHGGLAILGARDLCSGTLHKRQVFSLSASDFNDLFSYKPMLLNKRLELFGTEYAHLLRESSCSDHFAPIGYRVAV
jgi:hypothetical protein